MPAEPDGPQIPEFAVRAASLVLLLVHLALVVHGATRHSAVHDEVVYPSVGYAHLTAGDYRMNQEHPPFLRLLTGATWLGSGLSVRETPGWAEGDQWRFGIAMIYGEGRPHAALLLRARAAVAALSVLLGAAIFVVARRLGGPLAGLVALALYAFDPLAIAHAGLATTDLGSAALYFGAAVSFPWAIRRGGPAVAVSGALLGLALASKFSTLPLLALLAATPLLLGRRGAAAPGASAPAADAAALWLRAGGAAVVALAVVVATYGPAGPSLYLGGLARLRHHAEVGHPAYAFGLYASQGRWWFFPAAWAVKTPIPLLIAGAGGIAALVAALRRERALAALLLIAPALVAGPAVVSSLNLGVRHLLPVVPFLAVGGGIAAARVWRRGWAGRAAAGLLLAWLAAGTIRVHPDEMAYANEAAGGPSRLWRILSDSNVDWGQDLPALAREVSRSPLRTLYLGYFGTADPAAYGLRYRWIPSFGMAELREDDGPDPSGREWIAISVTNLMDVYSVNHDAHRWLRDRQTAALAGGSIALFDITGDAGAHLALGETALRFREYGAAEAPLRRAVEIDRGSAAGRVALAIALAGQGRVAEAAAECETAAGISPEAAAPGGICAELRGAGGVAAPGGTPYLPPPEERDR